MNHPRIPQDPFRKTNLTTAIPDFASDPQVTTPHLPHKTPTPDPIISEFEQTLFLERTLASEIFRQARVTIQEHITCLRNYLKVPQDSHFKLSPRNRLVLARSLTLANHKTLGDLVTERHLFLRNFMEERVSCFMTASEQVYDKLAQATIDEARREQLSETISHGIEDYFNFAEKQLDEFIADGRKHLSKFRVR